MSESNLETFSEAKVTYTIELNGKLFVIENVPARISAYSGEQFFAPETVEKIHAIINGGRPPARTVSVDVFEFAA
jgi:hypothetical protein